MRTWLCAADNTPENDAEDIYSIGPEVLVVTDGGMGKRSCVSTYRKTNRGARGVTNIKLREGENVLSVVQVCASDELLMTTERGQLVRIPVGEIRRVGRASKGVKIMNLNAKDRITGVAKIIEVEGAEKPAETAEGEVPETPENPVAEVPETPAPDAPANGESNE